MSLRSMTTSELNELALRYINNSLERAAIIEKIHNSNGQPAVRIFAEKIGVDCNEMINWTKKYYRAKKLHTHQKCDMAQVSDPPVCDINAEAAELAEELVGGNGGEWRQSRRNTFAKTMNSKARKQRNREQALGNDGIE